MIRRETDPEVVNRLVARDFPEGADFSEFLANPLNLCLLVGSNGTLLAWRGPGIYEVHLFYEVRGREALDVLAEVLAYMRDIHNAWLFWAMVPVESRAVRIFARLAGWVTQGKVDQPSGLHEVFTSKDVPCLLS